MSGRDRILEQSTVYSPAQQSRGCGVRRGGTERTAWCTNQVIRKPHAAPKHRDKHTYRWRRGWRQPRQRGPQRQQWGQPAGSCQCPARQRWRWWLQGGQATTQGPGSVKERDAQRHERREGRGLHPAFTRNLPDLPSTVMPPRLICQSAHTMSTKPSQNPW